MNNKIVGIIVVWLLIAIAILTAIGNETELINTESEESFRNDNQIITNLVNNWNFISLPFNQSVDKNDLIINYDGTDYNWNDAVMMGYVNNYIFGWNRTSQYYSFADIIEPGYGYWLYAGDNCEMWGQNISATNDDYITNIALNWNIMGIPSNESIEKIFLIINYNGNDYPWPQAISSGIINPYIFGWNRIGQYYIFSDIFEPGYSYWMYVYLGCNLFHSNIPPEICDDGTDNDNDNLTDCEDPDCYVDVDNDGYYALPCGDDCNDINNNINPGATEICDGKDNDCDDETDEGEDNPGCTNYYIDVDNDGYGDDSIPPKCLCGPDTPYTATQVGDCDDTNGNVHPGATEICNGIDDDCDGETDEDVDCNDYNVCTEDYCFNGNCINDPGACEGNPCNDGDPCTVADVCVNGVCVGTAIDCNDYNVCTEDSCFEGDCVNDPDPCNGQPCDDGDPNTINDICVNGTCVGTPIKNINVDNEKRDRLNNGDEATSFNLFDSPIPVYFSWNSNLIKFYRIILLLDL